MDGFIVTLSSHIYERVEHGSQVMHVGVCLQRGVCGSHMPPHMLHGSKSNNQQKQTRLHQVVSRPVLFKTAVQLIREHRIDLFTCVTH